MIGPVNGDSNYCSVDVNTKAARCAAVVAGDAGARVGRAGVREGEAAASPVSDSPRSSPTASPGVEQGGRLRESQPSCVGSRRRPRDIAKSECAFRVCRGRP